MDGRNQRERARGEKQGEELPPPKVHEEYERTQECCEYAGREDEAKVGPPHTG